MSDAGSKTTGGEATPTLTKPVRVALIGNPNTGKTTVFNALTGHRARVGNYAGVTVEKREGVLRDSPREVRILDLPGTYSLSAHSLDELVAARVLLGHLENEPRPDVVVVVLDAANLERNLFLATQVIEIGLPVIFALNMIDVAEKEGIAIDEAALSRTLGGPVIPMVARERKGIDNLSNLLEKSDVLGRPKSPAIYPEFFLEETDRLRSKFAEMGGLDQFLDPFLVKRPLLEISGEVESLIRAKNPAAGAAIDAAKLAIEENGIRLRALEATSRYRWIRERCSPAITMVDGHVAETYDFSDKVDAVLTHRIWGTAVFLVVMAVVFQSIYAWSAPLMDAIDGLFGGLGEVVAGSIAEGPLQSFLVDGVIAGVGGVLIFLPQICVLFFFISLLEDVGYMARAAFLMDRLLSRAGLSGRSFIPMLSSFACAIPGIMAARTIENPRDRLATILVAPLMSCSARLPVYTLMIAAFIPDKNLLPFVNLQGVVLLSMYLVGIFVAIPVTFILKKTLLKARTPSFLIELPPYRKPLLSNVFHRMVERGGEFVKRAGTVILAVSIIIWALAYYPRPASIEEEYQARVSTIESSIPEAEQEAALQHATAERDGVYLRQSFLGRSGRTLEPVFEPLGWDWRIGVAAIASFPAREVIIGVMGVIFDLGDAAEDESSMVDQLRRAERPDGSLLFNIPVALSIMVFFALCMQCAATLAIMRRETMSWRWPVFAFTYMTVLAYVGAFLTYQFFNWLLL